MPSTLRTKATRMSRAGCSALRELTTQEYKDNSNKDVTVWLSFMFAPKGNATITPILHMGKLWLRQINTPRKVEAEPEATSVQLQR